jgi:hypothetical protein
LAVTFDTSLLLSAMQLKYGGTSLVSAGSSGVSTTRPKTSPTAPWDSKSTAAKASDLVRTALAGRKLINETAAQLDVAGASKDYQKLFALYQGLNTLHGLAERASNDKITNAERNQLAKVFASGLAEVGGYAEGLKLDNLRLTRGAAVDMLPTQLNSTTPFGKADTDVGVPLENTTYTTQPIFTGKSTDEVPGFAGAVHFKIEVKKVNSTQTVDVDLSQMGATPRTMGAVVNFINDKLTAAGSVTRFSTVRIPGQEQTTKVGTTTVKLGTSPDRWALKVTGDIAEKISFQPVEQAGAVYLTQTAGIADNAATKDVNEESREQQFLKFQNDQTVGGAPSVPVAQTGEGFYVNGRVFARTLDADVKAVHKTVTGADGSVYMLADIGGAVEGQTIKGAQDVALLKYDSAGNLIFTRTLGAETSATGLGLAVSADGKIAVAGSSTGVFQEGDAGVDPTLSDSFVTLYDTGGDELWTQRRAARADDEATSVAFGAGGEVLVAGRARSNMPGAASIGGWDGYIQSFTGTKQPLGGYKVTTNFVQQFGTAATDGVAGMAVNGATLATVGIENGRAVVRRFDISNPAAPVLTATRDLGDLQGGSIAGIAFNGDDLIVAGATRNGSLTAGSLGAAYTGGVDAFVATLEDGFGSGSGSDALSYYGGSGADGATAMTVSGGKVWLAGSATAELPGADMAKIGKTDGYMVRLDPTTGAVEWGRRFTAKDGSAAPTSIAVDATGASALDRLGLPKGAMEYAQSQLVTSATSLRAGDQFQIRTDEGGRTGTVTIAADDTLQSLAAKIKRASGFRVQVQIAKDGDFQRLQIKPISARSTVEILAGRTDRDALKALGLPEGVIRVKPTLGKNDIDKDKVYGLALSRDLSLGDKASIKTALDQLGTSLSNVRTAYRDLAAQYAPKDPLATAQASGEVPAYLKAQAANYQAALDRLLGGG